VALGLYISVPFCPTKCSYCNFASGVFSKALFAGYVDRLCADIAGAESRATEMGCAFDRQVDSIYLGGGTPSLLPPDQLRRLFDAVRRNFAVSADAEITVECAPGTLAPEVLHALAACGVNRVSLGVQSMVDGEASSVGRRHTRAVVLDDVARLRTAGIHNLNLDLIAGLPHQTAATWEESLGQALAAGVPHLSVYMLEVDEDSRLGRELIAGGTRYHAHFVPQEDDTAEFYLRACERLERGEVRQYEISNFARAGFRSKHNLKYWTRQPYLGFGVDAHSMLPCADRGSDRPLGSSRAPRDGSESVRFCAPDSLDAYLAGGSTLGAPVTWNAAREEAFFLGLRLNAGVDLNEVRSHFGDAPSIEETVAALCREGLLQREQETIRLTPRGRLLSNEVFAQFLSPLPA
jgi:oxygen-independent coproporphyrinogen-3 oxidase